MNIRKPSFLRNQQVARRYPRWWWRNLGKLEPVVRIAWYVAVLVVIFTFAWLIMFL